VARAVRAINHEATNQATKENIIEALKASYDKTYEANEKAYGQRQDIYSIA